MKIEQQEISASTKMSIEIQYHITKDDIVISLIKFQPMFYNGMWETHQLEGKKIDNIDSRFSTYDEAVKEMKKVLGEE